MNLGIVAIFVALIILSLALASKYGKKTEQLKSAKDKIKKRAEEQYRAQKILSTYVNMSHADIDRRMRKKRKAAFKRMRSKN